MYTSLVAPEAQTQGTRLLWETWGVFYGLCQVQGSCQHSSVSLPICTGAKFRLLPPEHSLRSVPCHGCSHSGVSPQSRPCPRGSIPTSLPSPLSPFSRGVEIPKIFSYLPLTDFCHPLTPRQKGERPGWNPYISQPELAFKKEKFSCYY